MKSKELNVRNNLTPLGYSFIISSLGFTIVPALNVKINELTRQEVTDEKFFFKVNLNNKK